MNTHRRLSRTQWPAVLLLALYFLAAVRMVFNLPAHGTPNELLNFEYVQVMRQIGGLPNRGLVDSQIRYTEWHQPPVYFTFAAAVGLPIPVPPTDTNPPPPIEVERNPHYLSTERGNLVYVTHVTPQTTPLLYTSRLAAALLGILGVAALYRAGATLVAPWVGLLMASLMAFQPNYLHLSGSVNNDMPLTAVVAMAMAYALLLLHRIRREPGRPPRLLAWFLLGVAAVLAILTKANGIFVLAFVGVVWLAGATQRGRGLRGALGSAAAIALGLVPLWAGWLWLNAVRMGDALGLEGSLPVDRVLALSPVDFAHIVPYLPEIWRSYLLDWSAGTVGYGPDWLYAFWALALAGMLLGWLRPLVADRRQSTVVSDRSTDVSGLSSVVGRLLSPAALALLGFLGISYLYFAVKALMVKEAGFLVPEGRWWLPGLPALAWLAGAGFARWWPAGRAQAIACGAAAAVPPLLAFGLLATHLPYLYPRAERLPAAAAPLPEAALVYGDTLALTEATPAEAPSGEPTEIALTWRVLADITTDYTVSTQLLAPAPDGWRKLAEHNSYPGGGLDPTRGWAAGDVYRDLVVIRPGGELNGPTRALIQVTVGSDDQPLAAARAGQPADPPIAAETVVRPAEPLVPAGLLPEPIDYGGLFRLVGAEVDRAAAGSQLTLWWEALGPAPADYTIFAHLTDASGTLVAQADSPPDGGLSPTSLWRAGDIIRDVHRFDDHRFDGQRFPADTPVGDGWVIRVGAYRPDTGERLVATQGDTALPDNAAAIPLP